MTDQKEVEYQGKTEALLVSILDGLFTDKAALLRLHAKDKGAVFKELYSAGCKAVLVSMYVHETHGLVIFQAEPLDTQYADFDQSQCFGSPKTAAECAHMAMNWVKSTASERWLVDEDGAQVSSLHAPDGDVGWMLYDSKDLAQRSPTNVYSAVKPLVFVE